MSELVNTSEVAIPAVPNKNGKINLLDLGLKRNAPESGLLVRGVALYKVWRRDATFARGIYEIS
jgi:hypothetical protein